MYKSLIKIHSDCIYEDSQSIFVPCINCYYIHSIFLYMGGLANEEGSDFEIEHPFIKWRYEDFGATIEKSDSLRLEINYHYMKFEETTCFDFIIHDEFVDFDKSNKIASKHYMEGIFSLDNGLYKNSVTNFGTVLEALLNRKLNNVSLKKLIEQYEDISIIPHMEYVRNTRNKIHASAIVGNQDVTRKEAIECRNSLDRILNNIPRTSSDHPRL